MRPYTTHPEKFNWTNIKAELLVLLVHALILAFAIGICFLFTGCSVTKTIPVETIKERTKSDTLYINNVQYDSIYISQNRYTDRTKDTILIRQHDVEYRYKLLRDTIERIKLEVRHDSIPYQVTVTEVKEITRPLTWYDHLTRLTFWLIIGALLSILFIKIKRVF